MKLFNCIAKLIRKIKYRQKFNKFDCIQGLNPDKHDQVFESYFYMEEQERFNQ